MKWRSGEPYFVGWWRTKSDGYFKNEWRWWDGKYWSEAVTPDFGQEYVNALVGFKTGMPGIMWSTYYPKNARVPRREP